MKTCSKCKQIKSECEFDIKIKSKSQLQSQCKKCRYYSRLYNKFGITIEEYNDLHKSSNGCCFICKKSCKLSLDHNHSTGRYRGLLCSKCNFGIAKFKEKVDLLLEAIKYIEEHRE